MNKPILVGAVAYDPKVVSIWEGMRDYFRAVGPPIDYVLFSNYDQQVEALLARHIDVAWNTNLAWVKVHQRTGGKCHALAMRDVDARFTTLAVTRAESGIRSLSDLRGQRVALGSADSAQAAILPVWFLQEVGIDPVNECTLIRFDLDVGKHGDTGTSELEVLRALQEGTADAGFLGDSTWIRQVVEGRVNSNVLQVIWTSPAYCHCNFTALGAVPTEWGRHWTESLLRMDYGDPRWRGLMDQEGLKRWIPADADVLTGYRVLFAAAERQGRGEPGANPGPPTSATR